MTSLFLRPQFLLFRLIIAVVLSLSLIAGDGRSQVVKNFRIVLDSIGSNIYYLAATPKLTLDFIGSAFVDRSALQLENTLLKEELREKNAQLLKMQALQAENNRLSILLKSPIKVDELKKVARVVLSLQTNEQQQLVINRGLDESVFIGQPLIDQQGVVGQVVSVGKSTARVLLISDGASSVPVQLLRSNVRGILDGTNSSNELVIKNITKDKDVQIGDMLVTSGISGRFPEGYPIAKITKIEQSETSPFLSITAKPSADLDSLHYVLLLWTSSSDFNTTDGNSLQRVKERALFRHNADPSLIETTPVQRHKASE